MKIKEFLDKTPMELTEEELYELEKQIAKIEYDRKPIIERIESAEDIAHEVLYYAYDKSARGKIGINEIKQKPMKHFINILHFETRGNIAYTLRKSKTQKYLFNTLSFDQDNDEDSLITYKPIKDTYIDTRSIDKVEDNLNLIQILEQIDNTEDDKIIIKYGVSQENLGSKFSFRNFTKLYFDLFNGKKLTYKDFRGTLYNKETNQELEDKEIKKLICNFKKYMKRINVLGGNAECI